MRTTLDIDDVVLTVARVRARERGISLGAAVSELARRGLSTSAGVSRASTTGFPVFEAPTGAPVVTDDTVRRYRDESEG
ncbi:MAG TPA: antitoxin [Lapillicoccus sp.]|jgi:hypothetical protein|uniref:antitoxin n=1 Tax=Lapillicoccus sp. TaxID=1909287 RepID=UPI002F91C14B